MITDRAFMRLCRCMFSDKHEHLRLLVQTNASEIFTLVCSEQRVEVVVGSSAVAKAIHQSNS